MDAGIPRDGNAQAQSVTLHLDVISGNAAGRSLTVDDELIIGRLATGEGRLEEDPELSRHHARISRESDGQYAIEDLGSSNGTFVNGLALSSPGLLVAGDSIELGATTLVVREITGPPVETAEPTQATIAPDIFRDATVFARAVPEDLTEAQPQPESATSAPIQAEPEPEPPLDPEPAPEPVPHTVVDDDTETRSLPGRGPECPLPAFDVHVSLDPETRTASLQIGDDGQTLRFVAEDGRWALAD